jgi:hypothetical protein
LFSWSGKETVITCIASSVPQSNVSWEKDNQPITAGNGYSMSSVIIGDDTTGTLSVSVYHVDLITVWEIIILSNNQKPNM